VSILQQGLTLMATGMAVVFSFLVILIYVTKFISTIVLKYFPEKPLPVKLAAQAAHPVQSAKPAAAVHDGKQNEIAAAIAAAAFQRRQ
jgi:oxaloacetate decarboxylase (Na+ extruding) subunit gamma